MQACFTQKLCQRELCYGHVRDAITYSACKKLVRAIPFDVLLGDNIDNGHVFMGFTPSGTHLISYKCVIDDEYSLLHHYSLHWWRFNLGKLLKHEHEEPLFAAAASIKHQLLICVYQLVGSQWVLVLGSNPSQTGNSDPHYLTLARLPCDKACHSIHCFYEVFPPFTSIDRSLVLKIPGVVILNTVCSLIAIRYDCTSDNHHQFDHSIEHSVGCGFRKQSFSSVSTSNGESRLDQFSILPLHVRKEGEEMLEVCTNLKDDSSAVMIEQYNLDIEQWMSNCVESLLSAEQRFRLSQLVDYDVQLVEVDSEGVVIAAIVPLMAVLDQELGRIQFISLELVISWKIFKGHIELVSQSTPTVVDKRPPIGNWKGAQNLITTLKQFCSANIPSSVTVHSFSNLKLIKTGKPVYALKHHFLPIYIVYRPRKSDECSE